MGTPSLRNKSRSLLRLVEERALCKEEEKKILGSLYLPKDCIFNILLRLPLESLRRSRFVCKPWLNMINSSPFIDAHLHRSNTVLIFLRSISKDRQNSFSVEERIIGSKSVSIFQRSDLEQKEKFCMHFMEIKDGNCEIRELNASCLGKIMASCKGLVLLENKLKRGGLQVLNPVTRKCVALPLGTLFPPHQESYGFAFSPCARKYKVVHLFRDEMGYDGCEILTLDTRSWRMVDGPSFGLFSWIRYSPVSAIGALHWVPHYDRSDYIVYISMDDEKFHTKPLPHTSRIHDGLVEMGGSLAFVNHVDNHMDIWILKDLCGADWIKQHSITVGCLLDLVPLAGLRNGVMIFKRDDDMSLYAYEIELQQMKKIEVKKKYLPSNGFYVPHVNSLVAWATNTDQSRVDE